MRVRFLACAEAELAEAAAYYDRESPGLGSEFLAAVEKSLSRIQAYPLAWPLLSARTRRCRVSRFPYAIVYTPAGSSLLVVAVMHMRRSPTHWQDRLR